LTRQPQLPATQLTVTRTVLSGLFDLVALAFVASFDGFNDRWCWAPRLGALCRGPAPPALFVVVVSFVLANVLGKRLQVLSANVPQRPLGRHVR
jgi:hypothetical protein